MVLVSPRDLSPDASQAPVAERGVAADSPLSPSLGCACSRRSLGSPRPATR